jgi:hypothetical protein
VVAIQFVNKLLDGSEKVFLDHILVQLWVGKDDGLQERLVLVFENDEPNEEDTVD